MLTSILILALAVAPQEPQVFMLNTEENVWDVAFSDMNLDGNKDILLITNDETAFPMKKKIAVFLSDDNCAFPAEPDCILPLPEETGVALCAEVDGTPPAEILAIHTSGAHIFKFTGKDFESLGSVAFHSLLPSFSREPVFMQQGAKDLDKDGIEEWLIPTGAGLDLWNQRGLLASVSCDVVSEMRCGDSTVIVHRLPDYKTFDIAGEQSPGLAFLSDEFADFAHGSGWAERYRFRIPMSLEEKWDASAKMEDITGNGFPDLVVTQTRGTVRMESETHVYLAETPFKYPDKPNATFTCKGAVSSPVILDVNNDKKLDLVFIRISFGVGNIINFFVRGKLAIDAEVYLFDGKNYKNKADYSTTMTMDAPEGRQRVAYTFGDFNGDGLLDVAYGKSDDKFSVYTGDTKRFVSSRPWKTFDMPSFGSAAPYDLNGNDARDIVLIRPGGNLAKRVDVIVF